MDQMTLGWKVITGAVLLGIGQLLSAGMVDCPIPTWVPWLKWLSGMCNAAGAVIGGVGVSSKVMTVTNILTNAMTENRNVMTKSLSEQKFVEKVIERKVPYIVKRLGPDDEIMVKNNKVMVVEKFPAPPPKT